MIPGLKAIPAFNAGGAGSLSLAFVNYTVATGSTIALPSGAQAGDWAVLLDAAENDLNGAISSVTPTGYSNIVNGYINGDGALRMMVSHRVLTSGDIGVSLTGMNDNQERKVLLVFRPSSSIATATASTWNSELTLANPTSQTVTASGISTPLVVLAFAGVVASSAPAFSTETPAMTNLTRTGTNLSIRVGYTLYNTSPSNQSIDIGDGGANGLQSGYVRFT